MNNDLHDFEQFMKQREKVAGSYVNGDATPLGEIVTHHSPATFFKPMGGYRQDAEEVWTQYEGDSHIFESSDESYLEILHMAASDGLAYWVGFQHSMSHLRGVPEAVPFNLRVTELFRREGDSWKLIHRHVDSLIEEPQANPQ